MAESQILLMQFQAFKSRRVPRKLQCRQKLSMLLKLEAHDSMGRQHAKLLLREFHHLIPQRNQIRNI
jgi:hypothetical protein